MLGLSFVFSVIAIISLFSLATPIVKADPKPRTVRLSGRITDQSRIPLRHIKVRVDGCWWSDDNTSETDERGAFVSSAVRLNALCQLVAKDLRFEGSPGDVDLGQLEIGAADSLDIGTLSIQSSGRRGPVAVLSGPATVTPASSTAAQGGLPRRSRVAAAFIGLHGMTVIHSDGTVVEVPAQKGQIGCSSPIIREDGGAAGWLVDSDACCTSYPLHFALVVYAPSQPLTQFRGDGRAIFGWRFVGSTRIAFYQSFPHGEP
jgi:hypothetical protein